MQLFQFKTRRQSSSLLVSMLTMLLAASTAHPDVISSVTNQGSAGMPCVTSTWGPSPAPGIGSPICQVTDGGTTWTVTSITFDVGRVSGREMHLSASGSHSVLQGECTFVATTMFVLTEPSRVRLSGTLAGAFVAVTVGGASPVFQGNQNLDAFSVVQDVPPGTYIYTMNAGARNSSWTGDVLLTVMCPSDFDDSGTLSVQDIFAFLSTWFAGDPRANFNHFGGTNVGDIFDFLAAWFAGC